MGLTRGTPYADKKCVLCSGKADVYWVTVEGEVFLCRRCATGEPNDGGYSYLGSLIGDAIWCRYQHKGGSLVGLVEDTLRKLEAGIWRAVALRQKPVKRRQGKILGSC
ncbi:MAG TPA: hypothetical protein DCL13_03705 [Peptococcaceae bacterium]|nr:hypothetical protein [Peptococcaceae bacterium]